VAALQRSAGQCSGAQTARGRDARFSGIRSGTEIIISLGNQPLRVGKIGDNDLSKRTVKPVGKASQNRTVGTDVEIIERSGGTSVIGLYRGVAFAGKSGSQ